jgi:hypothetical protein
MFEPKKCIIPTVYCGKSKVIPKNQDGSIYVRRGTPNECMMKGFGAGSKIEKLKTLPKNSLQQIKYIGDVHEKKFKGYGIHTTTQLISHIKKMKSSSRVEKLLKNILLKKDGVIDKRAYNSTLLYLYENGVYGNLPSCIKIKV